MNDKSNAPSVECQVELEDLDKIADRCHIKSQILELLRIDSEVHSEYRYLDTEEFPRHSRSKENMYEQAGEQGVFLWMNLPEVRSRCNDSKLRLILRSMTALSIAADSAYRIWKMPSPNRSHQRKSLILLDQSQALMESSMRVVGLEGDHDQNLAYWWVRNNCESVKVLIEEHEEEQEYQDEGEYEPLSGGDAVEMVLEELSHLRGSAGLSEEFYWRGKL